MFALRATAISNTTCFVLPKEIMSELNIKNGDTVYLTPTQDGSYRLSAYHPKYEKNSSFLRKITQEPKEETLSET